MECGLPLEVWRIIVGLGSIQTFSRVLRVCKTLNGLGVKKQRIHEEIALREMREQSRNGHFYPSLFKQHCSPEVMQNFAAADATIFYVSTRACPDIRPEYVN